MRNSSADKLFQLTAVATLALTLTACGGDGSSSTVAQQTPAGATVSNSAPQALTSATEDSSPAAAQASTGAAEDNSNLHVNQQLLAQNTDAVDDNSSGQQPLSFNTTQLSRASSNSSQHSTHSVDTTQLSRASSNSSNHSTLSVDTTQLSRASSNSSNHSTLSVDTTQLSRASSDTSHHSTPPLATPQLAFTSPGSSHHSTPPLATPQLAFTPPGSSHHSTPPLSRMSSGTSNHSTPLITATQPTHSDDIPLIALTVNADQNDSHDTDLQHSTSSQLDNNEESHSPVAPTVITAAITEKLYEFDGKELKKFALEIQREEGKNDKIFLAKDENNSANPNLFIEVTTRNAEKNIESIAPNSDFTEITPLINGHLYLLTNEDKSKYYLLTPGKITEINERYVEKLKGTKFTNTASNNKTRISKTLNFAGIDNTPDLYLTPKDFIKSFTAEGSISKNDTDTIHLKAFEYIESNGEKRCVLMQSITDSTGKKTTFVYLSE